MKKFSIASIICILLTNIIYSQEFNIISYDESNFPLLSAKFYAFDQDGNQIVNDNPETLTILQDGEECIIHEISCPEVVEPPRLSIAMSIDISGSMASLMDCAKLTANNIVDAIPMPYSEMSFQTCNSTAKIIQDFTGNKVVFRNKIEGIRAGGKTDFYEQLLNTYTGVLNIAKRGKFRKVVIVYSDAGFSAFSDSDLQSCIDTCKKYDITFFACLYDAPGYNTKGIKSTLNALAEATGGKIYDGILTTEKVQEISASLLDEIKYDPCTVTWEHSKSCYSLLETEITHNGLALSDTIYYTTLPNQVKKLKFRPNKIVLKNKEPKVKFDTTIIVTAFYSDFNVSAIESDNPYFSMEPQAFSLKEGESIGLVLSFTPPDSSYYKAELNVVNDQCETFLYASAVMYGQDAYNKTLMVTHPNGGEKLVAGSDTNVTWLGITPDDIVAVQYSTNNGLSWKELAYQANGNKFLWENIPSVSHDSCLMKVVQLNPTYPLLDQRRFQANQGLVTGVSWKNDGNILASCGFSNEIILWDAQTGGIDRILSGHYPQVYDVAYSPDGNYMASIGEDNRIKIWETENYSCITWFWHNFPDYTKIIWSPDSRVIVCRTYKGLAKVIDVNTGSILKTFDEYKKNFYAVSWSSSQNLVAMNFEHEVRLYDGTSWGQIAAIDCGDTTVTSLDWSRDGTKLAIGNFDYTNNISRVLIWDAISQKIIRRIYNSGDKCIELDWNYNDSLIVASTETNKVQIFEADSGSLIYSTVADGLGSAIEWQPDFNVLVRTHTDDHLQICRFDNVPEVLYRLTGHQLGVNDVYWSHKYNKILSVDPGSAYIWDPVIGAIYKNQGALPSRAGNRYKEGIVVDYIIDPDNKFEVLYFVYNLWTGDTLHWLPELIKNPQGSYFSHDITKVIYYSKIYDLETSGHIQSIPGCYDLKWSLDDKYLALQNSHDYSIFDIEKNEEIAKLELDSIDYCDYEFNPMGDILAIGKSNGSIVLWNFLTDEIKEYKVTDNRIRDLEWSPNGRYLASSAYNSPIYIWDNNKNQCIMEIDGHDGTVNSLSWDADSKCLVSGGADHKVRTWIINYGSVIQEDVSDSLWAIVMPELSSHDINMGTVYTNDTKDTLLTTFLHNTGDYPITIKEMYLINVFNNEFEHVSGIPPVELAPGESYPVEYRFSPTTAGSKSSDIVIVTQAFRMTQKIYGEAIQNDIILRNDIIDFGEVPVGKSKDSLCRIIRNISPDNISIDSLVFTGPDNTSFSLSGPDKNIILGPSEEIEANFRFSPNFTGMANTGIKVYYKDYSAECLLLGTGTEKEKYCDASGFEYYGFMETDSLVYTGSAQLSSDFIRLTDNSENLAGAVWHFDKVNTGNGFEAGLSFRINGGDNMNTNEDSYPGADGIAFVLRNSDEYETGNIGGGLGYQSLSNALAVEVDLFANDKKQIVDLKDPNGNHIAVQRSVNEKILAVHNDDYSLGLNDEIIEIHDDNTIYYLMLRYDPEIEELRIYFDSLEQLNTPIITINDFDLNSLLNLEGKEQVLAGISSSTGQAFQAHDILSWYFCPYDTETKVAENCFKKKEDIITSPNPASDNIKVTLNNLNERIYSARIVNILGVGVLDITADIASGHFSINTGKLVPGTYFLELRTKSKILNRKIEIIK